MLDRPRHEQIIKEVREAGARIKLIYDGDVGGAIEVAKLGAPVDVLLGIGGTPEGDQSATSVLLFSQPSAALLEMRIHGVLCLQGPFCCMTLGLGACQCKRLFTWVWELDSIHHHQSLNVYVWHLAGVIAAAALKCMGGTMQGRLWPRNDEERKKAEEAGYDISKVRLN